jgi:hypothetical protein
MPARKRKHQPDFVKQVKRAIESGLDVRSVNFTADGVSMCSTPMTRQPPTRR